jgi:hypothetical protein
MTAQKEKTLRKRACKTVKKINCTTKKAFEVARSYARYIEETEIDAPCMCFDEYLENLSDFNS